MNARTPSFDPNTILGVNDMAPIPAIVPDSLNKKR